MRRITSTPSKSGRPRSTIARSGLCVPASMLARAPVGDSTTRYPSAPSDERRNLRISGSSSTTRIVAAAMSGLRRRFRGHLRRRLERQGEAKRAADAGYALGPDASAVQRDDRLADREPQADAVLELVENVLELAFAQAGAEILHRDHELAAARLRTQADQRARRRVACGVVEQVAERLLDQRAVDARERQVARQLDHHQMIGQALLQAPQHRTGDLVERMPVALQRDGAVLEAS